MPSPPCGFHAIPNAGCGVTYQGLAGELFWVSIGFIVPLSDARIEQVVNSRGSPHSVVGGRVIGAGQIVVGPGEVPAQAVVESKRGLDPPGVLYEEPECLLQFVQVIGSDAWQYESSFWL